jgi:hypothetical protein
MKTPLVIIVFGLLSYSAALARESPLEPVKLSDFANARPGRCAYRTAILDVIHQKTPADESIMVIARLGDGETRPNLSWRRLHNVRVYWTEYLYEEHRRKPETVILAEGEKVKGLGHLEFYVGGRLVGVMKVARNADLDVLPCHPDDFDEVERTGVFDPCQMMSARNFYPCRDGNGRRRNRR